MTGERIIGSEHIYDGRVIHLRIDTVALEDGHTFQREIIQHGGAVAMVPLDETGSVTLVRQYRAAADKHLLEIPAGGLEPGEPREECARRELQEEIGYYPEELIKLGGLYVAASYTTEYITIYLARKMVPSQLRGDIDERIAIEHIPFRRALAMALSNEIEDSKTLIGLVWAAHYLSTIPESEGGLR